MSWERQITIKSPQEIEIMRQAGRINAEALAAAKSIARPGVTTADLNAAAEEVLRKYGVYSPFKGYPGPTPYPASTNVSVNDTLLTDVDAGAAKFVVTVDFSGAMDTAAVPVLASRCRL